MGGLQQHLQSARAPACCLEAFLDPLAFTQAWPRALCTMTEGFLIFLPLASAAPKQDGSIPARGRLELCFLVGREAAARGWGCVSAASALAEPWPESSALPGGVLAATAVTFQLNVCFGPLISWSQGPAPCPRRTLACWQPPFPLFFQVP